MRFPIHITTDQVGYQIRKAAAGETRYPLVLMLEPLYTCNLACVGCSTERHTGKLSDRLPLETCLRALDECGAPDGLDLRRRADALPGAARADRRDHRAQEAHLSLHQRAGAGHQGVRQDRAAQAADDQRPPRRDARDARQGLRPRGRVRQGDRDDQGGQAARLPRHHQHHRLQGDVGRGDRGALQAGQEPGRRRAARLAGLPLRVGEGRHLPDQAGDPAQVPARAGALQGVPDAVDADVPGVRGRDARVRLLPLEHGDLHAQGVEEALLPDRRRVRRRTGPSSGPRPTGPTGSRARTRSARTARCTAGSRRRPCGASASSPKDMLRMAAWNFLG